MSVSTLPRTRNREQILAWANRQKTAPLSTAQTAAMDSVYPDWRATLNDQWKRSLDALESFVVEHGRFPSQHEKDRESRRLGVWLNSRRQEGGSLPTSRREEMDKRVPGWSMTSEQKWLASLEVAEAYVAEHGRLPSERSTDPAVASTARWIGKQRRAAFVPAHREVLLDDRLPIWREGMDDKWEAMLNYVVGFKAEHGRFPSKAATADNQEYRASAWLVRQRNGTGMTPKREARLDARLPRWRETTEDAWYQKLAAFESFYKENGRRPRQAAPEAAERSLGAWYSNALAGRLSKDRAAALAAADIGDCRSRDQTWSDTLEQVANFYAVHGRFPAGSGKEPNERQLGIWLANQRKEKGKLSPERHEVMGAKLPGWDLARKDLWPLKLQACIEFVELHGRMPSSGKNASVEEKKSADWIMDQRKPKNSGKLHRIAMLDERLPGWRGEASV